MKNNLGYIHSIEPLGTFDGPGLRFVVFMQGCNAGCYFCHNRDTWDITKGTPTSIDEIFEKYLQYEKFYKHGGITISGGEPLLQIDFLISLFNRFKQHGVSTIIDTSAFVFDQLDIEKYDELIELTDLFMVSIKSIGTLKSSVVPNVSSKPLQFIAYLETKNKPVILRYVLIPKLTDDKETLLKLKDFKDLHKNITKIEILPYKKIGISKWINLGLAYPLDGVDEPTKEEIVKAHKIIKE